MNRADLHKLANARIREAQVLLGAGEYSGAYYLSGYAVECALKACFAKTIKRHDFPEKGRTDKVFIHRLPELVLIVGLRTPLKEALKKEAFELRWITVSEWTEQSRYYLWNRNQAEQMLDAITHRKDGILPWLKRHW